MLSLKTVKNKVHQTPFNPLLQHANNTNTIIKWAECSKLQVVYSKKKLSDQEHRDYKRATNHLLYTFSAVFTDFSRQCPDRAKYSFDVVFVKANLNCLTPVESIYYSANNLSCCYHCGSHIPLLTSVNEYPMCSYCRDAKRNLVLKRFSFKNDKRCYFVSRT